ncbi:hypothetical protein [Streptomyces glaucus]
MAHEEGRMRDFVYPGSGGCRLHGTAPGQGPGLVPLYGGGPDRYSLLPSARHLTGGFTVALPDNRGPDRSVCTAQTRHVRARYGTGPPSVPIGTSETAVIRRVTR